MRLMANPAYERALATTVIKSVFDWKRRMNTLNQNTYRAQVMVEFIKNIDEMYLASVINGDNPG